MASRESYQKPAKGLLENMFLHSTVSQLIYLCSMYHIDCFTPAHLMTNSKLMTLYTRTMTVPSMQAMMTPDSAT